MLLNCPDCARSYHLVAADLGSHGRVVVCPCCDARWFQRSEGAPKVDAAAWAVTTLRGDATRTRAAPVATAAELAGWGRSVSWMDAGRTRLGAALLMLLVAGASLVGGRGLVVRAVPRTAAIFAAVRLPVNLRGLRFSMLVPTRAATTDVSLAGEIRSVARDRVRLPRLVFEVRGDSDVALLRWSESPPTATLAAGRAVAFASQPRRLPTEGRTVLVHFEEDDEAAPASAPARQVASR